MRNRTRSALLGALPFVMVVGLGASQPTCARFVATLSGDQEVPPVETDARGEALFFFSEVPDTRPPPPPPGEEGRRVHFKLIVANIEDVTQAHIHCGAADVNGPVVVFLFGFDPDGVTVSGIQAKGTFGEADVIPAADSAECPGGIAGLDDLLDKMKAGETYVNVHTLAFPAGEIRGQIAEAGR